MYVFFDKRWRIFEKHNETLKKVSNSIKKEFNSEPLFNKKYIQNVKKIKTKEGYQCIYTPVILIESIHRKDRNYYPQVFLEKHNYVVMENKMSSFNGDIEICSDDTYNIDSDGCKCSDDCYNENSTSSQTHLFTIRGRQKRGPGTLQTCD